MPFDWANCIPVVGHAKGLVHYVVGDVEGGNKAMKESTRTSVVMGAGAMGSIAGPGGSIALGTATGVLWDSVVSIVTDEPTGLVASTKKIADSVSNGEVPYDGVLDTCENLVGDAFGACGGGGLVRSCSKSAGKSAVTTVGKYIGRSAVRKAENAVVRTGVYMACDKVEEVIKNSLHVPPPRSDPPDEPSNPPPPPRSDQPSKPPPPKPQQDRSSGPTSGGSGQQPPRRNPSNTNEPPQQKQIESVWQKFLDLFKVESLDKIKIRGRHIFKSLEKSQKKYLKKIIKFLGEKGILKRVIETLKNIFNNVDIEDVTFANFLSWVEIITQFIVERAKIINARRRERQEFPDSYDERRTEPVRIACDEILPYDYTIVRVYTSIKDMIMIESLALSINFRDVFAAVYHYYKHRYVNGQVELSVNEYYTKLQINVEIIMTTKEYEELKEGGEIKFERYYEKYKTRFRIVIKKRNGCVILSTGFFLDDYDGTDEDGNMYINDRVFSPK